MYDEEVVSQFVYLFVCCASINDNKLVAVCHDVMSSLISVS
jgi:hypothetical protein